MPPIEATERRIERGQREAQPPSSCAPAKTSEPAEAGRGPRLADRDVGSRRSVSCPSSGRDEVAVGVDRPRSRASSCAEIRGLGDGGSAGFPAWSVVSGRAVRRGEASADVAGCGAVGRAAAAPARRWRKGADDRQRNQRSYASEVLPDGSLFLTPVLQRALHR